jgi:uncharacterized protein (TIGR02449 family)
METVELHALESRISELIELVGRLQQENEILRQRVATATQDRSVLQERQCGVAAKIKTIITELKEELG